MMKDMQAAGMLDALKVDIYGERLALKAVGSVSVRESQMLSVSPFDPQVPFPWYIQGYLGVVKPMLMYADLRSLLSHQMH